MATLLETIDIFGELFEFFLPFMLVFTVAYAILMKTKVVSDSANVNGVISFVLGFIFAISGGGPFLLRLVPFLSIMFIVIFLTLMLFLFFKVDVSKVLETRGVVTTLIIVVIFFVLFVIAEMYGAQIAGAPSVATGENVTIDAAMQAAPVGRETCDFTQALGPQALSCLMGHPKVLGTVIVLGLLAVGTFFVIYIPKK